jgi:hypothetical protein
MHGPKPMPLLRQCAATHAGGFGHVPSRESYLTAEQVNGPETFYSLHAHVCDKCFLAQLQQYVRPDPLFLVALFQLLAATTPVPSPSSD